ncbi:MAG: protein kinase [Bryobacteraceae bacterium]|jgi:predicted ATPase
MNVTPERWKEIEEIYHAAVDGGAEAQASILAQASTEVRAIVLELLAARAPAILNKPAWDGEDAVPMARPAITEGALLGPYRIESMVGEGGMGQVFLASDTRLQRKVAIKAIRQGQAAAGLEARFIEEARAASALNHPNIVTVYDVGTREGQPYIVMEWIEGQTLRQRLAHGALPMEESLPLAAQILDALGAAHGTGLIHRDLKPENIMVTASGRAKVLDFGIAKRITIASDAVTGTVLTNPGFAMGTPGYMSPEQTRGERLDFRSDHFAFGAVLYEATTGRRAFDGRSGTEIRDAVLKHQPAPLTSLNPRAPMPLQWLVERCLAKRVENRFASTEELRRELLSIAAASGRAEPTALSIDNFPAPRTALIGRGAELAELERLIADPERRIVTLTGPGGIGKTRLAIELARQTASQFSGGAAFVPLEKVTDAALVPFEVASALGVTQRQGDDIATAIMEHLRRLARPVLLVLDNFEHVMEAALFAARLTDERVKVLVTSRAALRVYGEHEFAVPSLNSGQGGGKEELLRSAAVQLFLERAPNLRAAAHDEDQLHTVSRICARLDGLPLAIELAAARTRLFSLRMLWARLDDPLGVLVGGAKDLPRRQHTLRATLDWSYNLLDAEHRRLFRRMAVFVGGATIEAIEAVCNTRQDLKLDLWGAIELLVDNSLIRRIDESDGEPRFALLETMREYGFERLDEADERAYTHKAHAAYFLVLAEDHPHLRRERAGKHPFDADLGNFRAALDWLAEAGEPEWGLRLVMALAMYFYSLRLHSEARDRIARLLNLPGVDRFPRLRNFGLFWKADFEFELGIPYREEILECWRQFEEARDPEGMFLVASRISFHARFIDLAESRRWSERVVELARENGDPALLAGALSNLADVSKDSTRYARSLYAEAMRLFATAGDEENAIWALSHQADLAREEGDVSQARGLYREALDKFRKLNFSHGVASCLHDLACIALDEGNPEEARGMYRESVSLYGPENPVELPRALEALAEIAMRSAQPEHALTLLAAAARIRERFHAPAACFSGAENQIEAARRAAGAEATAAWIRGWNMTPEQVVEYTLKTGADT